LVAPTSGVDFLTSSLAARTGVGRIRPRPRTRNLTFLLLVVLDPPLAIFFFFPFPRKRRPLVDVGSPFTSVPDRLRLSLFLFRVFAGPLYCFLFPCNKFVLPPPCRCKAGTASETFFVIPGPICPASIEIKPVSPSVTDPRVRLFLSLFSPSSLRVLSPPPADIIATFPSL